MTQEEIQKVGDDEGFIFCGKCGKRMKIDVDMPICWDCYYKQEEEEAIQETEIDETRVE